MRPAAYLGLPAGGAGCPAGPPPAGASRQPPPHGLRSPLGALGYVPGTCRKQGLRAPACRGVLGGRGPGACGRASSGPAAEPLAPTLAERMTPPEPHLPRRFWAAASSPAPAQPAQQTQEFRRQLVAVALSLRGPPAVPSAAAGPLLSTPGWARAESREAGDLGLKMTVPTASCPRSGGRSAGRLGVPAGARLPAVQLRPRVQAGAGGGGRRLQRDAPSALLLLPESSRLAEAGERPAPSRPSPSPGVDAAARGLGRPVHVLHEEHPPLLLVAGGGSCAA